MHRARRIVVHESGFEPTGKCVLLLPYKPEVESSPIIIPDNVKRNLDMVEIRGMVVAIGPEAWLNEQTGQMGIPRAQVGDQVMVSKFCGGLIRGPADDIQYRVINGRDIYGIVTSERSRIGQSYEPRGNLELEEASNG